MEEQLAGDCEVPVVGEAGTDETDRCELRDGEVNAQHILPLLDGHLPRSGMAHRELQSCCALHDLRLHHDHLRPSR